MELAIIPVTEEGKESTPALRSMGAFEGATGTYELFTSADGNPMVATDHWKLYVAKSPTGQLGLMKISTTGSNYLLEAEAQKLQILQQIAADLDAQATAEGKAPFNYGAFFPQVTEVVHTDDGRVALMLGYHASIATYRQLLPLALVLKGQRIDMKSATWLFGKLLKLLNFVHDVGYTAGFVDITNLFIEPDLHGVFVLDFSSASETPMDSEQIKEVTDAGLIVWHAVGGRDEKTPEPNPPFDEDLMTRDQYETYKSFIARVGRGGSKGAGLEHTALYTLSDSIWPKKEVAPGIIKRDFHSFVTYDL